MDFYPQDLLVGVFPLVFAVDATFPPPAVDAGAGADGVHRSLFERFLDVLVSSLMDDDESHDGKRHSLASTDANSRGLSLLGKNRIGGGAAGGSLGGADLGSSLGNGGGISDDDLLDLLATPLGGGGGSAQHESTTGRRPSLSGSAGGGTGGAFSGGFYAGLGRRISNSSQLHSNNSTHGGGSSQLIGGGSSHGGYAKALRHGQGFFQRARVEAVGTRHGFPPTRRKEARGGGSSSSNHELGGGGGGGSSSFDASDPASHAHVSPEVWFRKAQGVLSLGWLEKHVHALPSVIVLACRVHSQREIQYQQDQRLIETIEHFQDHNTAMRKSGRQQCQIHVVALLNDDVTLDVGEEWSRAIKSYVDEEPSPRDLLSPRGAAGSGSAAASSSVRISMLRPSLDLQTDTGRPSNSLAFQTLHDSVRDASLRYYQRQAARTKTKLHRLLSSLGGGSSTSASASHSSTAAASTMNRATSPDPSAALAAAMHPQHSTAIPPVLLPVVIRYCFKIAVFYEFQLQWEMSLRYLSEAWRQASLYHTYLVGLLSVPTDAIALRQESAAPPPDSHATTAVVHETASSEGDMEVSLSTSASHGDAASAAMIRPDSPVDCYYQVRAAAEWFNLKLLQAGLSSQTETGLWAAQEQWRRHHSAFCTQKLWATMGGSRLASAPFIPEWYEWQYIARQRLVFAQLVERNPPPPLLLRASQQASTATAAAASLGGAEQQQHQRDLEEIAIRFSPWRANESAAEARLRLARAVEVAAEDGSPPSNPVQHDTRDRDPMRRPYVTGIDNNANHNNIADGLAAELQNVRSVSHRAVALDHVLRAIALYERELEKEKKGFYAETEFMERCSSRSGARLSYLAGGILLGMKRHPEAVPHLEAAARYCTGWRQLELSIRRMLIECYEKTLPTAPSPSAESNQTIVSMLLDSYFNADMSSDDLRRALRHFASIRGAGKLTWYHEALDDEDSSVPVAFAVSFPGRTHATAGDTVRASVLITSNLDYAIHVNSVELQTLAGKLPIPSMDLSSAENASEGIDGGIIIQARTSIMISTELELPKDTSNIAVDDSGNGGEIQGVAGKGSFAKSARPRTAGITSAGGARLVSEEELTAGNRLSQGWNMKYLGGKPLRCDGMCLEFYPVQVAKSAGSTEAVTPIVLTIGKKKPKTAANIKRTPFEEENYIASAWSRPDSLKLSLGPRSLRVLPPLPDLVIENLTEQMTEGNGLEGTVNRVLLKLTSGARERCVDIKYKVTCFSVLMGQNGTTRRLVSESELVESEGAISMKNSSFRTPLLVTPGNDSSTVSTTDYGYDTPPGWKVAGTGQALSGRAIPSLSYGESGYVAIDLYRPSLLIHATGAPDSDDEDVGATALCKTDFYVSISYRQETAVRETGKRSSIRRSVTRQRPRMSSSTEEEPGASMPKAAQEAFAPIWPQDALFDEVSLEYTGSLVWSRPLCATFRHGASNVCPTEQSGTVQQTSNEESSNGNPFQVMNGENVTTTCAIQVESAVEGLKTEVIAIRYEDPVNAGIELSLVRSGTNSITNELYAPAPEDPCHLLSKGSTLSVAYTVRPQIKCPEDQAFPFTVALGALAVDWKPSPFPVPDEAKRELDMLNGITGHGPLRLDAPSTLRFAGPACAIQSPPFQVSIQTLPCAPRTGVPFELAYNLTNRTKFHQVLAVNMTDSKDGTNELLVAGASNGELTLSPQETRLLSYTMLATRAGKARLPLIELVSSRYAATVLNEKSAELYVFP